MIKNRVSIDERPEIVAEKSRIGDWEGDTVIGKNHKGGLVTRAERKSRYVLAGHIRSQHAESERTEVGHLLCPYHSWERGLNENSNGLLRQYFPKGMELTDLTKGKYWLR